MVVIAGVSLVLPFCRQSSRHHKHNGFVSVCTIVNNTGLCLSDYFSRPKIYSRFSIHFLSLSAGNNISLRRLWLCHNTYIVNEEKLHSLAKYYNLSRRVQVRMHQEKKNPTTNHHQYFGINLPGRLVNFCVRFFPMVVCHRCSASSRA